MNKKWLILVAILALFGGSWYTMFSNQEATKQELEGYLKEARRTAELGIDVDTIGNYKKALEVRDTIEIRTELAEYLKETDNILELQKWSEDIIEAYPYEAAGYEYMAYCHINNEKYYDFFDLYQTAKLRDIRSELLEQWYLDNRYQYYVQSYGNNIEVSIFSNGLWAVMDKEGNWGYVNADGETVIPFRYEDAKPFSSTGLAAVKKNGTYYLIDKEGNKKYIDPQQRIIQDCGMMVSNIMPVNFSGTYSYADQNFSPLFGTYDYAGTFNNQVAVVKEGGSWFIINDTGQKVSDTPWEGFIIDAKGIAFRNNVGFAKLGGSYYLVNTKGEKLSETPYEEAYLFPGEEPTAIKIGGKWGFIDSTGVEVIPAQYEEARPFSNNMAAVKINGAWGYINLENQIVIEPQFVEAREFTELGSAYVKLNQGWKLLKIYRLSNETY